MRTQAKRNRSKSKHMRFPEISRTNRSINTKPVVMTTAGILLFSQLGGPLFASPSLPSAETWAPTGIPSNLVWDSATPNWTSGAVPGSIWTNGGDALLGGSANTVTIAPAGVTANSVTVNGASGVYEFEGGNLALSGSALIVANSDLRVYSVITGSAGLNSSGAATLQLDAINTYSGATTVTNGLLQDGINNALPVGTALIVAGTAAVYDLNGHLQTVGSVSLQNGGTLDDQIGGGTLTSLTAYDLRSGSVYAALAGNVALNKTTAGSVFLYGNNTYLGATNVTAGNLAAGANGALPETTLLTVTGAGSGFDVNGYSVSAAGVSLQNGGLINDSFPSGNGSLTSASAFDMQDGTVKAVLSGTVGLNKTTAGTVVLDGANTFTGLTAVTAGELIINGSVAGAADISTGALLSGTGKVNGDVTNTGTLLPGNGTTPGKLTIGGNYTQTSAGALDINLASVSSYSTLLVIGSVQLAGALQVNYLNGFHPAAGENFTIIVAKGGDPGQFSLVTAPLNNLTPVVVYQPYDVLLEYRADSFAKLPNLTPNERSVAQAVDEVRNDPRKAALVKYLNSQSGTSLTDSFDLLSPEAIGAIFNISVAQADAQAANLGRRFDEIHEGITGFSAQGLNLHNTGATSVPPVGSHDNDDSQTSSDKQASPAKHYSQDPRWGYFVTGDGQFTSIGDDYNARGYDFTSAGTTVGLDYRLGPEVAVGFTAGYAHTWTSLFDNGSIGVDGGDAGLYATVFNKEGWYLDAVATGGGNSYDFRRTALGGQATGSTSGDQFDSFLRGGYDLHKSSWTFGPVVDVQYTYAGISAFTEQGSLAPLHIENQSYNSLQSRLGFRIVDQIKLHSVVLWPELRLGWQHEYLDASYDTSAQFATGAGNVFSVSTPSLGRDSALVTAGITVELTHRVSTSLYYDGQFASGKSNSQTVSAAVQVSF